MREIKVIECMSGVWDSDCDKCIDFWHKIIEEDSPDIIFELPRGCIDSDCAIDTSKDKYQLREVPESQPSDPYAPDGLWEPASRESLEFPHREIHIAFCSDVSCGRRHKCLDEWHRVKQETGEHFSFILKDTETTSRLICSPLKKNIRYATRDFDGIKYDVDAPAGYPESQIPEFQIGDRVEIVDSSSPYNNALGEVCAISNGRYEIALDIDMGWSDVVDKQGVWATPSALKKATIPEEPPQFKVGDRVRVKNNVSRRTLGSEKASHKLDGIEGKVRTVSDDAITVEYDWDGETYFTVIFPDQLEKVEESNVKEATPEMWAKWGNREEAKPMKQIKITDCWIGRCQNRNVCLNKWHEVINETDKDIRLRHDTGQVCSVDKCNIGFHIHSEGETKPMAKQIRVTVCTKHGTWVRCTDCLDRWHNLEFKRYDKGIAYDPTWLWFNWCQIQVSTITNIEANKKTMLSLDDWQLVVEIRELNEREEVSEVENQIGLYHVVAWEVDPEENRLGMAYHGWVIAKNKGNAQVKAMKESDWKGSDNPDDCAWTIALVS